MTEKQTIDYYDDFSSGYENERAQGYHAMLDDLELEISVLTRPSPVAGPEEFEVGRHGVVLRARGRNAVFLPQVAPEQGWDRTTTLRHLARKVGLAADVWRTPAAELSVFEAQVFAEVSAGVVEAREDEWWRWGSLRGRL